MRREERAEERAEERERGMTERGGRREEEW